MRFPEEDDSLHVGWKRDCVSGFPVFALSFRAYVPRDLELRAPSQRHSPIRLGEDAAGDPAVSEEATPRPGYCR